MNRTAFILDSLILAKNERYDIDDSFHVCYNNEATTPRPQVEKGGCIVVEMFYSFILSVMASVVAYYICKWLDKEDKR